jgi:flagellar basal-body rod protein FlgB
MIEDILRKTNNDVLSRAMDASMLRARTISNNIANVTTPGYRRVEVNFEEELRLALDKTRLKGFQTDSRHIDFGRKSLQDVHAEAYHPNDPALYSGVNNVDIDTEMAKLAETQISYNYLTKFSQGIFKKLNASIQSKSIQ